MSGWRAISIQNTVKLGLTNLPTVDSFNDLDLMIDDSIWDSHNVDALCDMFKDEIAAGFSRIENENNIHSDDEWKMMIERANLCNSGNEGRVPWWKRQKLTFLYICAAFKLRKNVSFFENTIWFCFLKMFDKFWYILLIVWSRF